MDFREIVTAEDLSGFEGSDWFTAVLGRKWSDQRVAAVTAAPVGTGQVGESVRFTLEWSRRGDTSAGVVRSEDSPRVDAPPASVIGKFPARDPQTRATARMVQTYEREFAFYTHLRDRVAIRTPMVHHVALDPSSGDFTLIMEDLGAAVQGDQLGGCTIDQAHAIAVAAAGLHGPTWNLAGPALQGADLSWVAMPDDASGRDREALYAAVMPGFIDRYRGRLAPEVFDAVAWLSTRLVAARHAADPTGTLGICITHNDFRLDNMLFGDGVTAPVLTTVDWQTLAAGYGPTDVAYALGSGLVPDVRAAHETDIFATYLRALVRQGVSGASEPEMAAQLWDAYRVGSIGGLAMAVTASMIVARTERGDEMFAVMAERHARQMDDLGVTAMIP